MAVPSTTDTVDAGTLHAFVVVTVAESDSDIADRLPLYEESFALVRASSIDDARERAENRFSGSHEYQNEKGQTIRWQTKVSMVIEALSDNFVDGQEIFARHFRNIDAYDRIAWESFDAR